jgi:isopenicillin-N N-acyltransferase-like protein
MVRLFLSGFFLFCSMVYGNDLIYRIGNGTLEESCHGVILRLEGKPYERGIQHGVLLKEKIQDNLARFIDNSSFKDNRRGKAFQEKLPTMLQYIPSDYLDEMRGIAHGADVSYEKILMLNLFSEMFHCIGLTVQKEASFDGALYHLRVLDYGIVGGLDLHKSALLMVVKPEGKIPFVSVGYTGFVGSVTGMNEKKISIGEIGGDGYGKWEGIPMSFLIRKVLEETASLEEAKALLASCPRTCEYYYVISDGNEEKAVGIYATPGQIRFIEPGASYAVVVSDEKSKNQEKSIEDKFFIGSLDSFHSDCQHRIHGEDGELVALFNYQPEHCIVLRGFGHPERYPILVDRIQSHYGKIGVESIQDMIKTPVTNETNLHNAIFRPSTLDFWVSHAGEEAPASEQSYAQFNLKELLGHHDYFVR